MIKRTATLMILCLVAFFASAQTMKVSGTVVDESGEPIIGASVKVTGTTLGVATNLDGKFTLDNVPRTARTIVVSYIGMLPVTTQIKPEMRIVMKSDSKQIDDVIVVAFGKQKREAFTGSAGVVNADKIAERQVNNPLSALNGKVSGVQMIEGNGPSSSPTIQIRGIGSLNAGNSPLIVVDGLPYAGYYSDINPADVESISVLKDAASNSLYGARGANGVILITTKTAKRGTATISVDAKWGYNEDAKVDYETVSDPRQYYELFFKSIYNKFHNADGLDAYSAYIKANQTMYKRGSEGGLGSILYSVPTGEYLIGQNGKLNPHATLGNIVTHNGKEYLLYPDDWKKEGLRKGFRQEYNIGINGGTDVFKTYASLGYMKNNGICYGSDYTRYSARLKSEYQARKWMTVGGNISYTHSESNASGNAFGAAHQIPPIYPLYLRDGQGNILQDRNGNMYDYGNGAVNGVTREIFLNEAPLQDDRLNVSTNSSNSYGMQGYTDISFIEELKLTLNVSIYNTENRDNDASNPYYGFDKTRGGQVGVSHYRTFAFNTQQLLNYSKAFGKHTVSALLGHEFTRNTSTTLTGRKNNIFAFKMNTELAGALSLVSTNSYKNFYNIEGFFFRGQYDYDNKLFASASFRRDGSSRFHPSHRWGNFWSFGGAWILTKEKWFKPTWVDMLKLKASFGQQGNDAIGDFYYSDFYNLSAVNGEGSLAFSNKGKRDITWETNTNMNLGFEFELFKHRLTGSVEYYQRKTTDMLLWFSVPPSLGYDGYYDNVGDMMNRGVELNLDADLIRTKAFTWAMNFNITHNHNNISYLPEQNKTLEKEGHAGYANSSRYVGEGLPINTWYIKKYAGVNEQGLGTWYYTDATTGDMKTTTDYSSADYYLGGSPHPDVYGGFGTSLRAYGFDLNVNFIYSLGGKAYDSGYEGMMRNPEPSIAPQAYHKDLLNAWSAENTNTSVPRFQYGDLNTSAFSDRFLVDASTLTFKSITLGYTFPTQLVKKLQLSSLRLFISCDNVAYWGKRKGFDPRTSLDGSVYDNSYSPMRTASAGISVKF
ncbi:TonB-dependent receptor [Hoylesella shahii]|jgi:tonB-linked outer membrane protein, susC/ragA family|uniref:SusC/RagA family TonB-linked outer membrane protein n=1 Tax=Hoylesella shahii TaxID=228603 RepID=UPI002352DF9D|nr:TonB-dependent receptor [Hoylesella shahii]